MVSLLLILTMSYPFAFYTSHCQFYICDKSSPRETGSEDFWTESAFNDRLAIEKGILGVGAECYGPVKGELVLLEVANDRLNFVEYDHTVEAGLEVKSGMIQILDCPTSGVELELKVIPGIYRVRVYSSNLASVIGDEGDDFYKVEIWPDKALERRVLKRFSRTEQ